MKLTLLLTFGYVHFISSLKTCMHYIAYVQGFYINVTIYGA